MCCRYLLLKNDLDALLEQLGAPVNGCAYLADRYNITPGVKIPVARKIPAPEKIPARECVSLLWNFTPSRAARTSGRKPPVLFNARAEGLWEKPAFRDAARSRRCLVPASGFYEWERAGRARLPWLFQMRRAEPFFMAGIWEPASGVGAPDSCAIITTEANDLMRPIHARMPAIIDAALAFAWLDGGENQEAPRALPRPFAAARMQARRVSAHVNNVRNEGVACVAPPEPDSRDDGMLPLF